VFWGTDLVFAAESHPGGTSPSAGVGDVGVYDPSFCDPAGEAFVFRGALFPTATVGTWTV
jgi:hypothetical protein